MRSLPSARPPGALAGSAPRRGATPCASPQSAADSLIPDTLAAMATDTEFQATAAALAARGQAALTADERAARRRSLAGLGLPAFGDRLKVWEGLDGGRARRGRQERSNADAVDTIRRQGQALVWARHTVAHRAAALHALALRLVGTEA